MGKTRQTPNDTGARPGRKRRVGQVRPGTNIAGNPVGHGGALRLVGYVRVSTEEQALGGVSLEAQEQRLRAYVQAHGFVLTAIERDEGVSGKVVPAKRPALARALATVNRGETDGLVFYKLDRLSRSVRDILKMADDAQKQGWHLCSVTEHIDTSTAAGNFTLGVLALLAEMERAQVGERTRMGMAQIAREGRARSSRLPFGYRIEGAPERTTLTPGERRRLVVHAGEMELLCFMEGQRRRGVGAQRIAKSLNSRNIVNPRTRMPWTTSTVAAILRTVAKRESASTTAV